MPTVYKPRPGLHPKAIARRKSLYSAKELAVLMKAYYRTLHKDYWPPMGFTEEWVLSIEKNAQAHLYCHVLLYLQYLGMDPKPWSLIKCTTGPNYYTHHTDAKRQGVWGEEPEGTGDDGPPSGKGAGRGTEQQ